MLVAGHLENSGCFCREREGEGTVRYREWKWDGVHGRDEGQGELVKTGVTPRDTGRARCEGFVSWIAYNGKLQGAQFGKTADGLRE